VSTKGALPAVGTVVPIVRKLPPSIKGTCDPGRNTDPAAGSNGSIPDRLGDVNAACTGVGAVGVVVSTDGATPRAGTLVVGTGVGMAASYALNEETPGTMSGSSNISNGRIEDVSENANDPGAERPNRPWGA
jgi:hypothetical protein